jgi:hypothetical protein
MSNFNGFNSVGGGGGGRGGGGGGGGRSGDGSKRKSAGKSGAGKRLKRDKHSGCDDHPEFLMPGCEDCHEISETNILCADDDVPHGDVCGVYGCDTPLTSTDLGEQCEGCAKRNGADGGNAVNGADDEGR